jgi:hypothetical protein
MVHWMIVFLTDANYAVVWHVAEQASITAKQTMLRIMIQLRGCLENPVTPWIVQHTISKPQRALHLGRPAFFGLRLRQTNAYQSTCPHKPSPKPFTVRWLL